MMTKGDQGFEAGSLGERVALERAAFVATKEARSKIAEAIDRAREAGLDLHEWEMKQIYTAITAAMFRLP